MLHIFKTCESPRRCDLPFCDFSPVCVCLVRLGLAYFHGGHTTVPLSVQSAIQVHTRIHMQTSTQTYACPATWKVPARTTQPTIHRCTAKRVPQKDTRAVINFTTTTQESKPKSTFKQLWACGLIVFLFCFYLRKCMWKDALGREKHSTTIWCLWDDS